MVIRSCAAPFCFCRNVPSCPESFEAESNVRAFPALDLYFTMMARGLFSLVCLGSATAFVSPFVGRHGMQAPRMG